MLKIPSWSPPALGQLFNSSYKEIPPDSLPFILYGWVLIHIQNNGMPCLLARAYKSKLIAFLQVGKLFSVKNLLKEEAIYPTLCN